MTARVRAPELNGRSWLNTGGAPLHLADLRGKIVVLDFWTFCCINCLHVLEELRPLEERYGDVLVTIGVHSPKFEHEKDPDALAAAVERYGVSHPVLDDPELLMWQEYAARAWPTLTVIDPEGYVVANMAGEGHGEGLGRLIAALIETHDAKGTLHRGDGPYVAPAPTGSTLRFPGKAIALGAGRGFLVSSSAQHQIVQLGPDGETVVRRFGDGTRGISDGTPQEASFSEPQGLCLLPVDVAGRAGYDVVVADTVNHALRGIRLSDGRVQTVAGTGAQQRGDVDLDALLTATEVDLSSPWDVAWYDSRVVVAMAGTHQLWWFDPVSSTTGVYAGTTVEALRDGELPDVWMAQPSGLSVGPGASGRLWVADSESSALRWVEAGTMHTAVGHGLFDFGLVDGPADEALMQHPLGVCALKDGTVLVADTYNGAVRHYDPDAGTLVTVVSGLAEPSDIVMDAEGSAWVVESAAHRLAALPALDTSATAIVEERRMRTERPATTLAPGPMTLDVIFTAAPGQKLDESFGPATRLEVSATPPSLLIDGAGVTTDLQRELVIADDVGGGVLQVIAQAATCDTDAEHAACHLTRQDWGVPIVVSRDAEVERLPLVLRGLDAGA